MLTAGLGEQDRVKITTFNQSAAKDAHTITVVELVDDTRGPTKEIDKKSDWLALRIREVLGMYFFSDYA